MFSRPLLGPWACKLVGKVSAGESSAALCFAADSGRWGHRLHAIDASMAPAIIHTAVVDFIKAMGTKPHRTSHRSPWQNGTAERWIGSCRRELLEHVVVLGERHLVRLVRAYISYYHEDRCHLWLNKDTPNERAVTQRPSPTAKVVALPRVGGLHHRYEWSEAA